jgi:hypothetical protein
LKFAQRPAGEGDAVRVVHEPIKDGVAKRRVADEVVPVLDRDLTRNERRASPAAVFNEFEQIPSFPIAEGREALII